MIPRDNNNTLGKRFPVISILSGIGLPSYDNSLSALLINRHSLFVNSKGDDFHNVHLYLNSALHDSIVTSVSYDKDVLSISLDDFSTHCFCNALVKISKMSMVHAKRICPVMLKFDKIRECSLAYINRNNKLIQLSKAKHLHKISSYLYDQVIKLEPDSIFIGILFWATSLRKRYLLLQIKCKRLTIVELQRKAFLELFGDKFIDLYDRYWKQRQKGVLFDYGKSAQFITDYLQHTDA
jgi:hypothetical protein